MSESVAGAVYASGHEEREEPVKLLAGFFPSLSLPASTKKKQGKRLSV